jgi:hypothetical protein
VGEEFGWAHRGLTIDLAAHAGGRLGALYERDGAEAGWSEAAALLRAVYDRFTEGFETADLKAAKALPARQHARFGER